MAVKDASSSTGKVPDGVRVYAWPHSVVTNSLTKAEFSAFILEASNLTSFHLSDTFIYIPLYHYANHAIGIHARPEEMDDCYQRHNTLYCCIAKRQML